MADDFYVSKRPSDEKVHTLYTAPKLIYMVYAVIANNTAEANPEYEFYIAPKGRKYNRNTLYLRSQDLGDYDYDTIAYYIPLGAGTRIGIKSLSAGDLTFTVWGWSSIP